MSEVQQKTTDLDIMQTENTYWEPGHISDSPIEVMLKTSCRFYSSQIPGQLVSGKSGKRVVQCFIMYLVFKIIYPARARRGGSDGKVGAPGIVVICSINKNRDH